MAYIINKTDGSELTELLDKTIDQTSTDLTLVGKNTSNYGELLNENFIKLLENFASSTPPNFPIRGQIWYDSNENRLKIYDGTQFKTSGGPIIASSRPTTLVQGDIWINNASNQMFFYDGQDTVLAGPLYTAEQGISGPEVVSVSDVSGNLRSIVKLWAGQSLLGIFSKDEFTPSTRDALDLTSEGFTGVIRKGFTQANDSQIKFYVTASKADALLDGLGNLKGVSSFLSTETDSTTIGQIRIQNAVPLVLGPTQNNEFRIDNLTFAIASNRSGQDFKLIVRNATVEVEAITVKTTTSRIGIFNSNPEQTLHVGGSAKISGNLEVTGTVKSSWISKSANYTAQPNEKILLAADVSPFTITLPASPVIGDFVSFIDASIQGLDFNPVTIDRNGQKINGAASNVVVSTEAAAFTLVYTGTNRGWAYDNVPV
jgi:hypothetical protein